MAGRIPFKAHDSPCLIGIIPAFDWLMEFIRGLTNLRRQKQPCVATIGNFDGGHLGHQAVLAQLKQHAAEAELISAVMIFEPQPIEFFSPEKAPSRLTRLREKLQLLEQQQLDRVVCLKFDQALAQLSAAEFVRDILVESLAVKKLIIGDDFRFARNREGDYAYLQQAGREHGFDVVNTASFNADDERVSSTLIRQALAEGDMQKATRLLGRPYRIHGRVVHGDKRGRQIGFATANIELHRYQSPVSGIFSGRVHGIGDTALDAVIYVGSKPVYNGNRITLEVHILDFDEALYGRYLEVEFREKIRGDSQFESEAALIEQITLDIEAARQSLAKLEETDS